jgi:hypothetical protein
MPSKTITELPVMVPATNVIAAMTGNTRPRPTGVGRGLGGGLVCVLEVALQEAFEGFAMAGFVSGHLVHGVVDGVVTQLLCQLG